MIAILPDGFEWLNVLYEIGVAHGLGKRALIVASPHSTIPFDLRSALVVRAGPGEFEPIHFALKQLLAASPTPIRRSHATVEPPEHPLGRTTDALLQQLNTAKQALSGYLLEEVVRKALEDSGVSLIAEPNSPELRPDFAAWVDALDSSLGNPFIVEVKKSINSVRQRADTVRQVNRYLEWSNSKWALVLYEEGPRGPFLMAGPDAQTILFQQLEDFIRHLRTQSFAQAVAEAHSRATLAEPA